MRISSEKFKHEIESIFYPSSLGEEIAKFLIYDDDIRLVTHIFVFSSAITDNSIIIAKPNDESCLNEVENHLRYLKKNGATTVSPGVFGLFISIDEFIPKFIDLLRKSITLEVIEYESDYR